jgi:hypothetical protein
VKEARSRSRRDTASARSITTEKSMSAAPMSSSVRNSFSIVSLKATPNTAIGIVPSTMYQPKRASGSCGSRSRARTERTHADAIAHSSLRKYTRTAAIVPSCTTAVKAAPGSSQPKNDGTMRR